jgi:hypothetical protein
MKMSLAQNKRLHGLLNLLGMMEDKKALVSYFSAKRTESARELEPHQAAALIDHLAADARARGLEADTGAAGPPALVAPPAPVAKRRGRPPGTGKPKPAKVPTAEQAQKMRRKIFAIGRALGWLTGNSPEDLAMNSAKLDKFLSEHGYLKKPLRYFTPAELPKLVSQFEQIQKHDKTAEASRAVKGLLAETGLSVTTKRT